MMSSIFHRISVRKFEDRPIEKEKIVQVLKAGMQAPSACNQQPWEFYVVTDKAVSYTHLDVYKRQPVSWSVVVVEYCLITIAPDFILCVLATAFSLKLRPVFLGMMHEYSMDRKVV